MATSILQSLAVTTAGAALSLAAISANSANAALTSYNFTLSGFDTPILGSFSYDESAVGGSPDDLAVSQVRDFRFDFLGQTFTQSNAQSFGITFNRWLFYASGFEGLSGAGEWEDETGVFDSYHASFFNPRGLQLARIIGLIDNQEQFSTGNLRVQVSRVEPSTTVVEPKSELGLLGLATLGLASLLRKKLASSYRHNLPAPDKSVS